MEAAAPDEAFARGYAETLPYPPNNVDSDRARTYARLLARAQGKAERCR